MLARNVALAASERSMTSNNLSAVGDVLASLLLCGVLIVGVCVSMLLFPVYHWRKWRQ
jgi:hypothetical protein